MIKGLLELFAKHSIEIQRQVKSIQDEAVLYSDYAVGQWHKEHVESYRCCQVGFKECTVIRKGILTDKVRHVTQE
jgi:hypothetical protein